MSGNNLLLDTNTALYLLKGDGVLKQYLEDKIFYVSCINEMELLGFNGIEKSEEMAIEFFLAECSVIDINQGIKNITISLRRQYKLKLPDAIVAATAIFLGIPLISADKHFGIITELTFVQYQP
jgi:predicted nucleic acid-binding protein